MPQRERHTAGLWREELRATLALALPLILTNLTQALIHGTDVLLLGWKGSLTLAAATLGINLYIPFMVFGMGLVTAAAPMMARELGARRHSVREVRRTVRQALWAAAAIVMPVWLALWHVEDLLIMMDQDPALAREAAKLMRGLQWGMLPLLFYFILRSFVSALERPLSALAVGGMAVIFNAFLNYGLIFGRFGFPELGIAGAGIGSSLSNLFMFLAMAAVVSVHPRFRRYHLFGHFCRPDWERFRALWRLGLPIALMVTLEVAVFNAAVFLMGLIGAASIAAHAVVIQLASITFMVPMGLSQAVTVRVGLAYGRQDKEGVTRAGWTALGVGVPFMALMALVMLLYPRSLIGFFLDMDDPANIDAAKLAISFLFVAALFQIVDGAQAIGAGMLRGLHDTRVPMTFAAIGYWVIGGAVGVALAFGLDWQGLGVWTGLAIGLAVVAVLMIARWTRRERLGLVDFPAAARSDDPRTVPSLP